MKKIIGITLILALFFISGCGVRGSPPDPSPSPSPSGPPTVLASPSPPKSPDPSPGPSGPPSAHPSVLRNFITRDGDRLMDGDKEFRFVGFNMQEWVRNWMKAYPSWAYGFSAYDDFEIEDAVRTAAIMGCEVIRLFRLTIASPGAQTQGGEYFIIGPGEFDDETFVILDKWLAECNKYGVRLIISFTDEAIYTYNAFAEWRGKDPSVFYTNAQIREDFKALIDYTLNRVNTVTGVKYKDDPAVFAWETGNELRLATDEWTSDIAEYIKSVDPNHLFLDGRWSWTASTLGVEFPTWDALNDPNIDIISDHLYPWAVVGNMSMAEKCHELKEKTRGKKPFVVGEFGYTDHAGYEELLDAVISGGTSGALMWAMAPRSKTGGFYFHDAMSGSTQMWAYHWPGFPSGDGFDEAECLRVLREKAYEIKGLPVPPITAPDAPMLFDDIETNHINWRGSTGAVCYDIERADSADGPWTVVGMDITDGDFQYKRLFADVSVTEGADYYYRVAAKNGGGRSGYSNVVGPKKGKLYTAGRDEISNPGFEAGTYGWSLSSGQLETTDANVFEGMRSAKLSTEYAGAILSQTIQVAMNKNYEVAFWARGGGIEISALSQDLYIVLGAEIATGGDGEWKRVAMRFNSGKHEYVTLRITMTDGGIYYFDSFSIGGFMTASDLTIVDGDFKKLWEAYNLEPEAKIVGDVPPGAAGSGLHVGASPGWVGILYTDIIGLEPDSVYEISFYAKADASAPYPRFSVYTNLGNPQVQVSPSPYYESIPEKEKWFRVTYAIKTPADPGNCRQTIQVTDGAGTYAGFTICQVGEYYPGWKITPAG